MEERAGNSQDQAHVFLAGSTGLSERRHIAVYLAFPKPQAANKNRLCFLQPVAGKKYRLMSYPNSRTSAERPYTHGVKK